ncbi:MAG: PilZ domain-containing protein [Proteobacteria bacterium]|nr:PilZ domain-containing protein [Pseudomonadota bacterium]
MTSVDHRNAERYLVRWRIALVFDEHDNKPTYHGRTHDLSLSGTGMVTEANVFTEAPVVILLAPPPLYEKHRPKIIEIAARQVYCVYSGALSGFHLGFQFTYFKGDGLQMIRERLEHHQPVRKGVLVRQ